MANHAPTPAPIADPIVAPPGHSPAAASRPDTVLDQEQYHTYEGHPAPWWVALTWIGFFAFGFVYLLLNLMR